MKFDVLLKEYEDKLAWCKRVLEDKTPDFISGFKTANFLWFQELKRRECEDFNPKMRSYTKKEHKEFKKKHFPLLGIIDYRGVKIPVYDDDYGQSMFCVLPNGEQISGGAYNLSPEEDFCYMCDEYLEKEFFNEK